MNPTLTLDGGLLRQHKLLPSVLQLRNWERQGKLQLFESDRSKDQSSVNAWETGAPKRPKSRFPSPRKRDGSAATFNRIALVLFPNRDPNRLGMNEINDVAHLLRHHLQAYSAFITVNIDTFISAGKREALKAAFKIVVMTPDEAVEALNPEGAFAVPRVAIV